MIDWIVRRLQSKVARYAVCVIALLIAASLSLLIHHFKLPRQITAYAFLLVIIGSAWWGGYGPGVVTTFATLLLGPYLTQSTYSIRHPNLNTLPMILLISLLISRMAAAREKLRETNEMLDERVRQRTAELEMANDALREREAQLMAQAERLSESNTDLEQFAYFVSHDLQEPLRMISIYTQLLEENHRDKFDSESKRYAQVVCDSVRRMDLLVHDLLMYSRAIHSDLTEQGPIDPRDALLVATNNLESQIREAGAEVIFSEYPLVVAHQVQLVQIFQNLIGNAVKYRSGDPPKIRVTATPRQHECVFSVTDNGMGISADYHEKIFVPFKRLHGQQYPGSGVGLAICRRIVERLGGKIWVESKLGHGSTFLFTIPMASVEEPEQAPAVSVGVV